MGELTVNEEATSGLPVNFGNSSLAVSLARAEVDQQITTAHAYPRSIARAVKGIMTLATLDEQTAEECVYALPRGGKAIKGPSIRFAEIIGSQWGNCRIGARVVHVDRIEKYVEAEGVFHDLETNTATTARVRRRLSKKTGGLFDEDMIVVTGNAACAIAKRNAILGGIPKAAWRKAYEAVESVIAGDLKTLSERRDRAMKAFAAFGVTSEQVFKALAIAGPDDVTLDHMGTLTAMRSALKNGEATVEEMFPKERPTGPAPATLSEKLDALARRPEPAPEPEEPAEEEPEHDPETGEIIGVNEEAQKAVEEMEARIVGREPEPPQQQPQQQPEDDTFPGDTLATPASDLYIAAHEYACKGRKRFDPWIQRLRPDQKDELKPDMAHLTQIAREADAQQKKA
jgi:hypothetical protein